MCVFVFFYKACYKSLIHVFTTVLPVYALWKFMLIEWTTIRYYSHWWYRTYVKITWFSELPINTNRHLQCTLIHTGLPTYMSAPSCMNTPNFTERITSLPDLYLQPMHILSLHLKPTPGKNNPRPYILLCFFSLLWISSYKPLFCACFLHDSFSGKRINAETFPTSKLPLLDKTPCTDLHPRTTLNHSSITSGDRPRPTPSTAAIYNSTSQLVTKIVAPCTGIQLDAPFLHNANPLSDVGPLTDSATLLRGLDIHRVPQLRTQLYNTSLTATRQCSNHLHTAPES